MKVLLTGSSGFLGRNILEYLLQKNHTVGILLRKDSSEILKCNKNNNVIQMPSKLKEDIYFSVNNFKPEIIIHSACCYGRNGESKTEMKKANFFYGKDIIEASIKAKLNLFFLNISTPLPEKLNEYSKTKYLFKKSISEISLKSSNNIKHIEFCPQHLLGQDKDETKFASYVINSISRGDKEILLTKGTQKRDFIHVHDFLSAIDVVLEYLNELPNNEKFEVGLGTAVSIRKFVELTKRLIGSSTKLNFGAIKTRENEVEFLEADTKKLKALGWNAEFNLESSIIKSISKGI